ASRPCCEERDQVAGLGLKALDLARELRGPDVVPLGARTGNEEVRNVPQPPQASQFPRSGSRTTDREGRREGRTRRRSGDLRGSQHGTEGTACWASQRAGLGTVRQRWESLFWRPGRVKTLWRPGK